jgi:hypothetical protein
MPRQLSPISPLMRCHQGRQPLTIEAYQVMYVVSDHHILDAYSRFQCSEVFSKEKPLGKSNIYKLLKRARPEHRDHKRGTPL